MPNNDDERQAARARAYILRVRNMIQLGLRPELALYLVLLELGWKDPA